MHKNENRLDAATRQEIRKLTIRFYGVKHRCGRDRYYRHVKFGFTTAREAAEYMLAACGPLPPDDTSKRGARQRTVYKSIDRIDGRRGYEPGNMRYATMAEQLANRRFKSLEQYRERPSSGRLGTATSLLKGALHAS